MRKLSDQERELLQLISNAGGSICPGSGISIPREGHKSLRRMERAGLLRVEETDDGPRFHLTSLGMEEANA